MQLEKAKAKAMEVEVLVVVVVVVSSCLEQEVKGSARLARPPWILLKFRVSVDRSLHTTTRGGPSSSSCSSMKNLPPGPARQGCHD